MINKIRSEFKAEILLVAEAYGVSCKFNDEERTCTLKEKNGNKAFSYTHSIKFAKDVALNTKYEVTYITTRGQDIINFINGTFDIEKTHELLAEPSAAVKCLAIKPTYAIKR